MYLLAPASLWPASRPAAKLRSPVGTLLQLGGDRWLTPALYDSIPAGPN